MATDTVQPSSVAKEEAPAPSKQVWAYAKLVGKGFEYFVQSYPIILGRQTTTSGGPDVPLSEFKGISRKHAKIDYNYSTCGFEITCLGKNGMAINGKGISHTDAPIALQTKDRILIGDVPFYFLLPLNPKKRPPPTTSSTSAPTTSTTTAEGPSKKIVTPKEEQVIGETS